MKLEEVKEIVFKEKPVFASIYKEYKDKNWLEYLKNKKVAPSPLSKENLELIKAFESILTPLLGEKKSKNAKETMEGNFFVSTCDHHGILSHPFFLNTALARSSKEISEESKSVIVLSCGGVSTSNSSYPRGIFFHNEKLEEIKMPFVSLKHRKRSVYGLAAVTKEIFKKIFDQTLAKIDALAERKIEQLKDKILENKKIFEVPTFSEQCTIINNLLWQETFSDRGDLIYLEMESVVSKLLLDVHLKEVTEIQKILLEKTWRQDFLQNLEGVQGAHDTKVKKGSHFFWYLDQNDNERKQLFLKDQELVTLDKKIKIPLNKESLENLLRERKILPTMSLCFSVLSFYHGLSCGGGFSQVQYLAEMHEAYKKTLSKMDAGVKLPHNVLDNNLHSDIFTGEFVLATLSSKKETVPATLADLFIYGNFDLSLKIDSVIKKVTISESLDAMMPEFYKIITGKKVEIENLPLLQKTLSVMEKPKCKYCGNNPTNHLWAYITQSATVPLTPFFRMMSVVDGKFAQSLAKVVLTPYLWLFQGLKIVKFNKDRNKAFTKRSEVIWQEAEKRGIEMQQFTILNKPIEQYRAKIDGKWRYFESIPLPDGGSSPSYKWMDDKALLKKKFIKVNVKVAYGASVTSFKEALNIFNKSEKPVIVKPQLGSRGRHTTTHIYKIEQLKKAYDIAKQLCHYVVVEEHLFGSVYRATYVGGEIVGILRGDPPRIRGDGVHNINELIDIKNENKREQVKDVIVSPQILEFLERQNFTLDTVLPENKIVDLSEKIGISYGGFAVEEFSKTHKKLLSQLKYAGDFLKAPVVGFDFIIPDATSDPDTQKWGIIEANSLPFINLHHFPIEGTPINVAAKVWDLWN